MAEYLRDPLRWSRGPTVAIAPREERRCANRAEWIGEHFGTAGAPDGHGFTQANLADGSTWYHYDEIPGVRLIILDTTNAAGGVDGCLRDRQYRWLTQRLIEVHAEYQDEAGNPVSTGNVDRVVVLLSHHGLSTLTNGARADAETTRPHLSEQIEALVHRFSNVVLWLSGHTHVNKVTVRKRPGSGFWEVSTSSLAEWPVQVRCISLSIAGSVLRIRCTMLDSDAPAAPTTGWCLADLASLHREIAGNDDGSVGGLNAHGTPDDRNVDLLVPLAASTAAAVSRASRLGRRAPR